ncbi:hypothetical protein AB1N83_012266 [Pleurotus pulmonarius]
MFFTPSSDGVGSEILQRGILKNMPEGSRSWRDLGNVLGNTMRCAVLVASRQRNPSNQQRTSANVNLGSLDLSAMNKPHASTSYEAGIGPHVESVYGSYYTIIIAGGR